MAEAVLERTAKKVARSVDQLKHMRSRRKPWDEVNGSIPEVGGRDQDKNKKIAAESRFAVLNDGWETDEEMDGPEEQGNGGKPNGQEAVPLLKRRVVPSGGLIVPEIVLAPATDDEIL
jgi:hypothetical protein